VKHPSSLSPALTVFMADQAVISWAVHKSRKSTPLCTGLANVPRPTWSEPPRNHGQPTMPVGRRYSRPSDEATSVAIPTALGDLPRSRC
jgi:hypothetical protein